jgi:hypothetical protein
MPHSSPVLYRAWRKRRARELRSKLLSQLGGACCLCGAVHAIQIDHPDGRTYAPSNLSKYNRILRYVREAKLGLVRLLCRKCNAKDGRRRQLLAKKDDENPF